MGSPLPRGTDAAATESAASNGRPPVAAVAAPLVSVVIPCLDEASAIAGCVAQARVTLATADLDGEVIVVDNGSADGSGDLARAAGATVVSESRRGYGFAYRAGFEAARGSYVVMGDADGSYDFAELTRFVEALEGGADFVIGTRLRGRIHPGAMSWLHRYVGNPLLNGLLNVLHGAGISDSHCGLRAFRRADLEKLELQSTGMELASEQVIRAVQLGLVIRELPIDYRPRIGRSKL
ncbi:MAG: glycosyltransferase family 2 protein, partial [Gammaproteobacteria bacterium]